MDSARIFRGWRVPAESVLRFDECALPRTRGCSIQQAINDGEDYELLFAISEDETEALQRAWAREFPKLLLTRIGRLTSPIRQATNDNFAAMFISNSVEETISFGRKRAEQFRAGDILALTGDLGAG